jgi:hypothetical protein
MFSLDNYSSYLPKQFPSPEKREGWGDEGGFAALIPRFSFLGERERQLPSRAE